MILAVLDIGDIFGDIFRRLCLAAADARGGSASNGPMKGADIRVRVLDISIRGSLSLECDKGIGRSIKRSHVQPATEQGQKPGTITCRLVRSAEEKARLCLYVRSPSSARYRNVQTCPDCHGTGKIIKERCLDCHGTGYISRKKKIAVSIPAGIDNWTMCQNP